jgi:methyl-accepting chemotaxis protein
VSDGASLVDQARQTMAAIVGKIGKVTQIISEISSASQEQSSGIQQVNQVLAEMDRVTQQNAALVEQTSAAVESLEQQARYLAEVVSVFKLGSSGEPVQEYAQEDRLPASQLLTDAALEPRRLPT